MYWQTREHQKYLEGTKVPRIRAGTTVPPGAVNLAYAYAPLPSVAKNVKIIDVEDIATGNVNYTDPIFMWPNKNCLLQNIAEQAEVPGYRPLVTNVFRDGIPLFYKYRLEYYMFSQEKPDSAGFYSGSSIQLMNQYGFPASIKWQVGIIPVQGKKNLYYVDIYLENEDKFYVVYDAIDLRPDGKKATYTGHKELCKALPVFVEKKNLADIINANFMDQVFYRTNDEKFGTSRVFVPGGIIQDNRIPQQFRYSIRTEIQKTGEEAMIFFTPSYYGEVYNKESLLPHEYDSYERGSKILGSLSAKELIDPFIPNNLKDLQDAIYTYSVTCNNPEVRVKTRPDGLGILYATTTQDTGQVEITGEYNSFFEDRTQSFSFEIQLIYNDIVIATKLYEKEIKKSTGQMKVMALTSTFSIFGDGIPLSQSQLEQSKFRINYLPDTSGRTPAVDLMVADMNGNLVYGESGELFFPYSVIRDDITLYATSKGSYYYYAPSYAVKADDRNRIRLLPPLEDGPFESWYLRIQSGLFTRTVLDSSGNQSTLAYFLPEYERQPYSELGTPYRKVEKEKPIIENKYTIRVRRTPLVVNDSAAIRVRVNGAPVDSIDFDSKSGTVELRSTIMETDHLEVDYYYKETCLTYKGYVDEGSLNWFLDLNPGYGHSFNYVDKNNKFRSEATFKLLNQTIYVYLKPAALLDDKGRIVPGTFNPRCIIHSFEPIYVQDGILIGMVNVRPHLTKEGLKIIDTRTRGGGVKPELVERAIEIEPQSEYYWDIGLFDGQPYMESGVGVIRLPKRILKEFGGKFTQEQVEASVMKYINWGTLPLIEYIDIGEFIVQKPMHPTIERSIDTSSYLKPGHVTVEYNKEFDMVARPRHTTIEILNTQREV